MESLTIICPKCSHSFALEEVAKHVVDELVSSEVASKLGEAKSAQLAELRKQVLKEDEDARRDTQTELKLLQSQVRELTEARSADDAELLALRKQVGEAKDQEKKFLAAKAKLEEDQKDLDLKVQRAVDTERQSIFDRALEKASEQAREDYGKKLLEAEKKAADATRTAEHLKRQLEQGSQQLQGELAEIALEKTLREHFYEDTISEVPKGVRGADVIQTVNGRANQPWGVILWESKETQNWSDDWCGKLLQDQRATSANVSVIVTRAMPSGVSGFDFYKGVWVTNKHSFLGLAQALRMALHDLFVTKRMLEGQTDKAALLYKYILSPDFKNKIDAIQRTFERLQTELHQEKTAIQKIWSSRERSLDSMRQLVAGVYGDIQGYAGGELQEPETLSLPSPEEDSEDQQDEQLPF